jgi:hypothetical protein
VEVEASPSGRVEIPSAYLRHGVERPGEHALEGAIDLRHSLMAVEAGGILPLEGEAQIRRRERE